MQHHFTPVRAGIGERHVIELDALAQTVERPVALRRLGLARGIQHPCHLLERSAQALQLAPRPLQGPHMRLQPVEQDDERDDQRETHLRVPGADHHRQEQHGVQNLRQRRQRSLSDLQDEGGAANRIGRRVEYRLLPALLAEDADQASGMHQVEHPRAADQQQSLPVLGNGGAGQKHRPGAGGGERNERFENVTLDERQSERDQ